LQEDLLKVKKRIDEKVAEQEQDDTQNVYDDADSTITLYNQAVIYYQMRQYSSALSILEGLFQNIEPIDEYLAVKTCFLLADLYLILKQKDKVSLIIAYLDKTFPQLIKDPEKTKETEDKEQKEKEEKEIQQILIDMTPSEFKYNLHILKAKLFLANKSMKASKREIKLAMATQHQNLTTNILLMTTYLKANLEYQQQNSNKAIKLLNSFQKSSEKHVAVLYFNNLGCIHFRMKKYNAAANYFTRALKDNEAMIEAADPKSITSFYRSKRLHILYNIGTKLLFTGNPELAFKCFQESSLIFYKQPKLWLRLAECCIAAHVKKLQENNKLKSARNGLYRKVAGNEQVKRILLPVNDATVNKGLPVEDQEVIDDQLGVQYGSLSLEYGCKAIRNALFLLSRENNSVPVPTPTTTLPNSSNNNVNNSTNSSTSSISVNEEELLLKQAILVAASFLALSCNNPVVALSYAKELLSIKKCSDQYKYLAHIYAAESYCMLNRPADAAQHLNPNTLGLTEPSGNLVIFSSPYPQPESGLTVRYSMYVNLAVVNILRDDLLQAQQCVNQALTISKQATPALLLQVYLELRKGNVESALQLLKTNSGFSPPKIE